MGIQGFLYMFIPPYCFITIAVLLIMSLITVFGINSIKSIVLPDIEIKNPVLRTSVKLALTNWLAVLISIVMMYLLSIMIPYLGDVHSEWGVRYTHLFWNAGTLYLILWTLLAVIITVWLYLRKESTFISKRMNRLILTIYLIEFAILWLLTNGYIYLILWRDRTMM